MEDLADVLKPLAALVVKDGVCLGGLKPAQRRAVLALAACAIERGAALREADVNASLRAFLKGDGVFIATDHVELRRWLIDLQWLQRDGYGRAYQRVAPAALAPEQQALLDALEGLPYGSFVSGLRAQAAARRLARRQHWEYGSP